MAEFKLSAGATVDLLTKPELDASLKAGSDAEWAQRARGIKRLRFRIFPGAALSTSAGYVYNVTPNQGYVWSLRLIAVSLSAGVAVNANFYLGTDTNSGLTSTTGLIPLAGTSQTGAAGGVVSATWGKGGAWVDPGEFPVVWASGTATLAAVYMTVVETPQELAWKVA